MIVAFDIVEKMLMLNYGEPNSYMALEASRLYFKLYADALLTCIVEEDGSIELGITFNEETRGILLEPSGVSSWRLRFVPPDSP